MSDSYNGISINTTKNTHKTVFSLLTTNKQATIADIPSGNGAFVQRLIDHGYKNVKAVDIENILQIDHNDFTVGDMTKPFPFTDKSIDSIVCIDGIEHIYEQSHFIQESLRSLKKGGELIISTPNISSLKSRWKWLMSGHHHKCDSPLDENNPNPLHHIAMISFPKVRYMLHRFGFKIIKVTTNRIKPANWVFAVLIPFVFITTFIRYRKKGKKNNILHINREILRTMFSRDVLFGETLIVKALK